MTVAPPPGVGAFIATGPADAYLPRTYPQLLRGPAHRWWRPLASLGVGLAGLLAVFALITVVLVVAALANPQFGEDLVEMGQTGAVMTPELELPLLLLTNVTLAAFIPIALLAVRGGHGWSGRWVHSVVGRVRWRFLLACAALALAIQAVATGAATLLDRPTLAEPSRDAMALLLVVLLTTPFQAAGEEYAMRGWLTQTIASWIVRPTVAIVVSGLVTASLFAAAHGEQDFWLSLDRFAFGVLASYLTWRTGGLEAAVAIHAMNNVVVFIPVIATGSLSETLNTTAVPPGLVLIDIVIMVITAALVSRLADRMHIQRMFLPPVR